MRTKTIASHTLERPLENPRWRLAVLATLGLGMIAWLVSTPPMPQNPDYHDFADQRTLLGVPHLWNVVSNLPFGLIGAVGCWWLIRARGHESAFDEPWERRAYYVFFLGGLLTCIGSAYYHANPNTETLVWDRLALSLMLTSLFTIVIAEFVSPSAGKLLLAPLVLLGLLSVVSWSLGEAVGHGDLRIYVFVQFFPVLAIPFIASAFRSRYTHGRLVLLLWGLYALAKICELFDWPIYQLTGFWSGHTFKHLVAAAASYCVLHALRLRSRRSDLSLRTERVGQATPA